MIWKYDSHLIGKVGIFGVCEDILKRLSIFQRFFIVQNNDVKRKRIYFIHYIHKLHMIWLFDRDFAKLWKKSWIDVDKCVVLVYNIQVWCADMAQLVEQLIRNEQVVGSSPTISSILVIPNGYSPEKARIYGLFWCLESGKF